MNDLVLVFNEHIIKQNIFLFISTIVIALIIIVISFILAKREVKLNNKKTKIYKKIERGIK